MRKTLYITLLGILVGVLTTFTSVLVKNETVKVITVHDTLIVHDTIRIK